MNKILILCLSLLIVSSLNNDALFHLVKLQNKDAVCLDGSPGAYYISNDGDPKKIYL
jgi:hypothetical protein